MLAIPLLSTGWRVSSSPSKVAGAVTIEPVIIPSGLTRASSVSQMYQLAVDAQHIDKTYYVGNAPSIATNTITIQNNCVQNSLTLTVRFPNFLQIVPFGLVTERTSDFTTQQYIIHEFDGNIPGGFIDSTFVPPGGFTFFSAISPDDVVFRTPPPPPVPSANIDSGIGVNVTPTNYILQIQVSFVESYARLKSQTPVRNVISQIGYEIKPNNVTAPVLVLSNPPIL